VSGGAGTGTTGDTISLKLPRGSSFRPVALLVVGGLAARLDLTLETLEDLEIAIETLLEVGRPGEEITLELRVENGSIHASVGPVDANVVRHKLAGEGHSGVGLRRVLSTVADHVDLAEREGIAWLSVEKQIPREEQPSVR